MSRFGSLEPDLIQNGGCTDVYFLRSQAVLEKAGVNPHVVLEVSVASLPSGFGILAGLDSVLELFSGKPVTVSSLPEGSIFFEGEPVMVIEGFYQDIARFETALLGFLCHASGIATAAAHVVSLAAGRPVYSFGSRRQHPAIAPMIERAAWIGGVAGVSNTAAPDGIPLAGTMPHAFVLSFDTPESAWAAFAEYADPDVPRIMLCDTLSDEKAEALAAARIGCSAVRLDTPRSRRGDIRSIIDEVRWELDTHGYQDVQIFLSGGVTAPDVAALADIVDAFGVGGAIANAPVIDFSADIVEKNTLAIAKRGRRSGRKQVWRLQNGSRRILPFTEAPPTGAAPLLREVIRAGRPVVTVSTEESRRRAAEEMQEMRRMGEMRIKGEM
ncbi:nicotinate phosphoribosyltransferase [Methanocalculus natronophilus]|uniref:nicotinate phosphoribosyltransferase n=1 Tax=Methanocalculus natronophilus TaxID=1262400 RepID=UPI0031B5BB56